MSGHLYIDDQSSVVEWDTGAMDGYEYLPESHEDVGYRRGRVELRLAAASAVPAQQGGIAVNGANGEIYVSNPADGKVYVFASTPPGVAADAAANVSETGATLQGSVDPRGVPVTSCEFEYEKVTRSKSRSTYFRCLSPLSPTVSHVRRRRRRSGRAQARWGCLPISAVSKPGVLYHFRLVGGNAGGTSPSEGMFAAADAGFGIKGFSVSFLNQDGTPDTQAGSHPYEMVTSFTFNTKAAPKIAYADSLY